MKRFLIGLALAAICIIPRPALALEPITVDALTLPFGTASYTGDMALESLFKELKGPVTVMLRQTPGAMYMARYIVENTEAMRQGKVPFTLMGLTAPIVPYMAAGLPPYQEYPTKDLRIISQVGGVGIVFVTFDKNIKTMPDFIGKKVGVAERSRPNMSTLLNQPVFKKGGYGEYDKVNWQYLGFANSKDAIMNGSIDVHMGNITAEIEKTPEGVMQIKTCTMDPAVMEVVSAGKPFHIVSENPEVLKTIYDPNTEQVYMPVLLKAGAIPGQTEDVWIRGAYVVSAVDKDMPEEVVEEIVYQMFHNKARLIDYAESYRYIGDNPYPIGVDKKWIHPGLYRAVKRLDVALPEGVTAP